ncbi:pectinesterase family protein [Paenibacillus rigui]|uniref:Protein PlyC n=1 Tax=Paenibacillus rigui TaxID=554312 RepID=A0A229UQ00_9BACL|nr:pectinesterase family protein [Paenibacillus rigui]OXM85440.1 protein PlyC [Paenibacillus rigui]
MKKALYIGICCLLMLNVLLFPGMDIAHAATVDSVVSNPAQLKASPGNNQVTLSWGAVTGATSYKVKRSTVNGGPYDTLVASNVTNPTFTDSTVQNGTTYYYVVTAVSSAAESMISNQARAVPYTPVAGAPAAPADVAGAANDGSVELTWSAVSGATSYAVKRSVVSGGPYTTLTSTLTTTSYTDTSVTNGTTYYYIVAAANASGESAISEEAAVSPAMVITVAQNGTGDFSNIKSALESIPANNTTRKIIYIKAGSYNEKLSVTVPYVSMIGEGKDKTRIFYNDNEFTPVSGNGTATLPALDTATLTVGGTKDRADGTRTTANYFYAANLSIENASDVTKGRALAARVISDQVVFENVRFVGYQDTLYTGVTYYDKTGRQYYRNCEIKGSVDFIYGPSTAAVFDQCDIVSMNGPSRSGGYITAGATQNAAGELPGFVFMNSRLLKDSTTQGKHYLGRPWQDQPTVRYINTWMDDHIHQDGWAEMTDNLTYFYSEYNSTGPGASPSTRKLAADTDPAHFAMTAEQASNLTIPRIFGGWDPSIRVVYPKIFESVTPVVDPALPDGVLGSYMKPVLVYMEVNNDLPAANRVQYRINNGPWVTYTSAFTVSDAGANTVEYRYVDAAGRAGTSKKISLNINLAENTRTPAFPGAEGGGMYATGGRGGSVYVVNNLLDYAEGALPIPGSFRDAVSQPNRTIIFSVSGTIHLAQPLTIGKPNLTIAGQTAPGDGIALSGYAVKIGSGTSTAGGNIIVRYIRFRGGETLLDDTFNITGDNVILDHVSGSWSTDELFSSENNKNFTLQWSFITDSLNHSIHTKGPHGYGGIWGGSNATFAHNLITNHVNRNPRFARATDIPNYPQKIDFRNNVIYNWAGNTIYGGEMATGINIVNNYFKPGPNTYNSFSRIVAPSAGDAGGGAFYISGNYMVGDPEVTANNLVKNANGSYKAINPDSTFTLKTTPFIYPDANDSIGGPTTTDTAEAAYQKVLLHGGASLPKRDSLDARIVNEVKNGTGRTVNKIANDGGLPELLSVPAPMDSDGDGMPDTWEAAHGLDPNDNGLDSNGNKIAGNPNGSFGDMDGNGYTNLEDYINSLADTPVQSNPIVSVDTPAKHQAFVVNDPIQLSATATAAASGATIAKVIFYDRDQKIAEVSSAPYQFTWTDAVEGQHYIYAKAIDSNGVMTLSDAVIAYVNGPANAAPWSSQDVGTVQIPGTANMTGTAYKVKGSGEIDINGTSDAFHYVYQPVKGNFELYANVSFESEYDEDVKAGFMLRESLDPASKATGVFLSTDPTDDFSVDTSGRKISVINRTAAGSKYKEQLRRSSSLKAPYWIKMERVANKVSGYVSKDGVDWSLVASNDVDYGETVYVGMAVDAPKTTTNIDYLMAANFTDLHLYGSAEFTLDNAASGTVETPAYIITGTVKDRAKISVVNNGVSVVDAVYTEAGGTFSKPITLNEGVNTIVVSASNEELFGSSVSSKTIVVTYNKTSVVYTPSVHIPNVVNSHSYSLVGSISRDASVTVMVNGKVVLDHVKQLKNVSFTVPISLKEGSNEIVVSSVDDYQVSGYQTYQVTYVKNWGDQLFNVAGLTLTDRSGNAVSGLVSSSDVVAAISVHNNSAVSQNGVLVIGLFDQQNRMVRYSIVSNMFASGEDKQMKAILRVPDIVLGYQLKAFVWDSTTSQIRISNEVTIR